MHFNKLKDGQNKRNKHSLKIESNTQYLCMGCIVVYIGVLTKIL